MKNYFKQRKINKLKIKIAGLEERLRILLVRTRGEHWSYEQDDLMKTCQTIAMLQMQLGILTYGEPKT